MKATIFTLPATLIASIIVAPCYLHATKDESLEDFLRQLESSDVTLPPEPKTKAAEKPISEPAKPGATREEKQPEKGGTKAPTPTIKLPKTTHQATNKQEKEILDLVRIKIIPIANKLWQAIESPETAKSLEASKKNREAKEKAAASKAASRGGGKPRYTSVGGSGGGRPWGGGGHTGGRPSFGGGSSGGGGGGYHTPRSQSFQHESSTSQKPTSSTAGSSGTSASSSKSNDDDSRTRTIGTDKKKLKEAKLKVKAEEEAKKKKEEEQKELKNLITNIEQEANLLSSTLRDWTKKYNEHAADRPNFKVHQAKDEDVVKQLQDHFKPLKEALEKLKALNPEEYFKQLAKIKGVQEKDWDAAIKPHDADAAQRGLLNEEDHEGDAANPATYKGKVKALRIEIEDFKRLINLKAPAPAP